MDALRRAPAWAWAASWLVLAVLAFDWWWWGVGEPLLLGWFPFWAGYHLALQGLLIAHLVLFIRCYPASEWSEPGADLSEHQ